MKKKLDLITLQIDLARQKETVQYVKDYIDFAKENGYNSVLLYLEAAIKVECTPFFNAEETYTPDEIREIVAYGNERGIDIIPGLENLAHMENFFRHKELSYMAECKDAQVDGRGIWSGYGDCICVSDPKAVEFMQTYYSQVIPLFTSQYVHAGMDEPFDFAVCPKCVERLKNGETKADLFCDYLMRTYRLVKSFGRTMMMWDDFFAYLDVVDRLPRDIIMCTWNYTYITDEVGGHWINYKKKDWFQLYDQLGFQYVFCPYADPTAKLYNPDSFTDYAMKYHPKGVVMTVWERSSRFNLAGYPAIAYGGRLWSGKAKQEDKLKIYTEILGNEEAADLVLNVHSGGACHQSYNLKMCENMTLARYLGLNLREYTVRKMKAVYDTMEDGLGKDIFMDIYTITADGYLALRMQKLCQDVFDNYESRNKKPAYFVKQLEQMKELSNELYEQNKVLWAKYRPGIQSFKNAFNNKYLNRAKRYDNMIAELEKNEKRGVFYAQLLLPCPYGTPRIKIEIHYKDKSIPATIHKTNAKVSEGSNTIRFAMENKPVDYVIYSLHGEGASYPAHFRYTYGGKKYEVSSVTKLSGEIKNVKKILLNDTQFAELGNNDGQQHFEDINVSKIEHAIKLKFKRLR